MRLILGTRLGPYEITAQLGAGGMGEVYRATDTKLKRSVAMKVLPEALTTDGERLARFQREAEVLASLNHPNIAAIYGLEESTDAKALVMELVEGPTLADRIAQGPIQLDEALPIARQIAEALEAAHERGIIHRDLKPANISLRPDGVVKVLDFGLAKALEPVSDGSIFATTAPTISSPAMMTGVGTLLGTAAYMSPEQARGKGVDKRSDVWAFGCVLFEMLTGRRAFDGSNVADTIGAALHKDPDWRLLSNATPPAVRATLERCLQKDPRQRARDLGDVRLAIDGGFGAHPAQTKGAASPIRPWALAIAVVTTAAILLPAVWMGRRSPDAPIRVPVRFQIAPPDGTEFGDFFSVSPDGRTLVFQAVELGRGPQFWMHSFETNTTRLLTRVNPTNSSQFWSPDSRYFAYAERGEVRRLAVAGGPPEVITALPRSFGGGAWAPDGTIIFGSPSGPLMRVSASGSTPAPLTALDASRQETGHIGPWMLRDGRHFVYLRNSRVAANSGLWVGSLDAAPDAQPAARLLATPQGAVVAPGSGSTTDYLLFAREGSLVAQAFDISTFRLIGNASQIAERIAIGPPTYAQVSVSDNDTLVYRRPDAPRGGTPAFFNRTGREQRVVPGINDSAAQYPRLSPDSTRLAIFIAGDLWVYNLQGRPPVRLTYGALGYSPLWTRDGQSIVYESAPPGGLRMLPADGTAMTPEPVGPAGHDHPLAWSADGRFLIRALNQSGEQRWRLMHGPLGVDVKPTAVFESASSDGFGGASLHPDGRWLAYESNALGAREIWVQPYPGGGSPVRLSANGGSEPTWNRNGRELIYLQGDDVMSVAVNVSGSTFTSKPAVRLFGMRTPVRTQAPSYDVAADGSLLMLKPLPVIRAPLEIVLNWRGVLGRPAAVASEH
ncbi:MAG TPA: protein kinase [Vicinamibacterales bacterium]|nr:protein kinase [Vicinamibacterales bacterium]